MAVEAQEAPVGAVLVVTHDHEEAFALADRVVVIREGRVEQDDAATTVWRRPATAFVAEFLGYNVTRAFGSLVAVRPDGLAIDGHGPLAAQVIDRRQHLAALEQLFVRADTIEADEVDCRLIRVRVDQEDIHVSSATHKATLTIRQPCLRA